MKCFKKPAGFQYDVSIDLNMRYYHIELEKVQVTYVQLFSLGENIVTNVYQWELIIPQNISNRR